MLKTKDIVKQNDELNKNLPEEAKIFIEIVEMGDGDHIDNNEPVDFEENTYTDGKIKNVLDLSKDN